MGTLRLLVYVDGEYGLRILENIRLRAPRDWEICSVRLSEDLPPIVEEPDEFVGELLISGVWDLVLFMGESPSAFILLPSIIASSTAKAVIAPVDDYSWLPLGLERQIRSELEDLGVAYVFPRPFCSLSPTGISSIDEFAEVFGRPVVKVKVEGSQISEVNVLRGSPCGSTWFMAEKLKGVDVSEAGAKAGMFVQIYPCLASRRIERLIGDAPIHVAGHLAEKAVTRAIDEKN